MDMISCSKSHFLWGLLLAFLPFLAFAQSDNKYELRGQILDGSTNEPMTVVTVRLLRADNGNLVKGATTDTKGTFVMSSLPKGEYSLSISFVGYKKKDLKVVLSTQEKVNLGKLKIEPNTTALKGIEVTGAIRPVVLKTDTVEFNASAFKVRSGANIEELLKRLPGVEVDADGNITYNGEKIEKIELDGRNFFSQDPKMATRNLPSNMVDKVQVVDKQSDESILTGIDDGIRTKVLNLSIKPDMKRGLVANANAGYGTEKRYTGDMMINFFDKNARYSLIGNLNNTEGVISGDGDRDVRRIGLNYETTVDKKLEMTAEVRYSGHNNNKSGGVRRENIVGRETRNVYNEDYRDLSRRDEVSGITRIEWKPDSLTTIFLTPEVSWTKSYTSSSQSYQTVNQQGALINTGNSTRTNNNNDINTLLEVHVSRKLSPKGRHIYMGLEGDLNSTHGAGQNLVETHFVQKQKGTETIDQTLDTHSRSLRLVARTSYTEPLTPFWALQLNYRFESQHRKNLREAYNKDGAGNYTLLDDLYTRGSDNTFYTQSLGLNLRYKVDRSHITFGINARPTYANTISTIGGKEVFNQSRTVWNFYPSVRVEYRKSDSIMFNLGYNGRTAQASMEQLNPAVIINSPLNKVKGNPDLLPSFSHFLRFMGNYNSPYKRQTFGMMGRASWTNNAIVDRRVIDPATGAAQTTYENVSGLISAGLGLTGAIPLGRSGFSLFIQARAGYDRAKTYVNDYLNTADIWTPTIAPKITWKGENISISLGGKGYWQHVSNSIAIDLNRTSAVYSLINELNWTLPWEIEFASNIDYTRRSGYSQSLDTDVCLWDLSLSKSFLKNNAATLELSVYDILGQRNTMSRSITSSYITDRTVNTISTYGLITFKYKFNSFGKNLESSNQRGGRGGFQRYRGAPPFRLMN